jgi:hypothetical protein
MEKDAHTTDVIFRIDTSKDFKGTVFALFPHEVCDQRGNVTTYQHIGQHSGGDYRTCLEKSRLATSKESESLKKEMEGLGYNINVVKKQTYKKFLESYKSVRGL